MVGGGGGTYALYSTFICLPTVYRTNNMEASGCVGERTACKYASSIYD